MVQSSEFYDPISKEANGPPLISARPGVAIVITELLRALSCQDRGIALGMENLKTGRNWNSGQNHANLFESELSQWGRSWPEKRSDWPRRCFMIPEATSYDLRSMNNVSEGAVDNSDDLDWP